MAFDIISNIPQAKRAEVKEAIWEVLPNNEAIPDPHWVDPGPEADPLDRIAPMIAKFTDAEWAEEIIWRYLKKLYRKGRDRKRDREAVDLTDIRN